VLLADIVNNAGSGQAHELGERAFARATVFGLVSKIQPAGEIVREIADEAKAILRRLAQ